MSLRDDLTRRFPALASLPPHSTVIGGAIRDLLLNRVPADVDIECDAAASEAATVGKVIELGRGDLKVHRVVRNGLVYDFSERTDLLRRDFTMNAIALDLTTGEIDDPFEGREDIRRGLIRMIRPENFQDDPLRTLRGVRLALQCGFEIEANTMGAMRRRAAQITTIAAERVRYELDAIFSFGKFLTALRLLNDAALDEPLFGFALYPNEFTSDDVSCAGAYALVLRDPVRFAERWKWSRELLRKVLTLQRLLREPDLYAIYEARATELPSLFRAVGGEVPPMPDFSLRALLDGNEIAAITQAEGPQLGAVKRALVTAQLRGDVTTKEAAREFVRKV
jgi:tRNA nucleotidyltransferase/poly(A) polymerase